MAPDPGTQESPHCGVGGWGFHSLTVILFREIKNFLCAEEKGEEKEGETPHNSLRRKKKCQKLLVQGLWKVWPCLVCVAVCQNWNVQTGGHVGRRQMV